MSKDQLKRPVKQAISARDLSSVIDNSIKGKESTNGIEHLTKAVYDKLIADGFTHFEHGGIHTPISITYISRKIIKRRYVLRTKGVSVTPIEKEPVEVSWDVDLSKRTERNNLVSISKKYDSLMEEYERVKKVLDIKDVVYNTVQDFRIPVKAKQSDTSIAVVVASDWHYEERITPDSVNMLNDYSLSIADNRIRNFFGNTVKVLNKEQRDSKINTMVLALLGDFITGNIHEDNVESSQLGVAEALWAVKSRIHSGIQFILDNTDVNLVIPCASGNHGRSTKKQRIANEHNNSFEWLIYKALAEAWGKHKRVQFLVGESYHTYIELFPGYTARFHHGHFVKYGGGVGGITIPMNKAIAQWNRNRNVQLDCCGHFHQFTDGGHFVVNGSLIGFSPYAVSIKGAYEKPSQTFFLVNGKHLEKTMTTKIFLEG